MLRLSPNLISAITVIALSTILLNFKGEFRTSASTSFSSTNYDTSSIYSIQKRLFKNVVQPFLDADSSTQQYIISQPDSIQVQLAYSTLNVSEDSVSSIFTDFDAIYDDISLNYSDVEIKARMMYNTFTLLRTQGVYNTDNYDITDFENYIVTGEPPSEIGNCYDAFEDGVLLATAGFGSAMIGSVISGGGLIVTAFGFAGTIAGLYFNFCRCLERIYGYGC